MDFLSIFDRKLTTVRFSLGKNMNFAEGDDTKKKKNALFPLLGNTYCHTSKIIQIYAGTIKKKKGKK